MAAFGLPQRQHRFDCHQVIIQSTVHNTTYYFTKYVVYVAVMVNMFTDHNEAGAEQDAYKH